MNTQIKSPLNFTIMKALISILILVFFTTVTPTYGQALPGTKPVPLSCTFTDPLTPVAGRAYDYSAIIHPLGGNAYWYATRSTIFTTGGIRSATEIPADGGLISVGATNYRTSTTSPASPTTTNVTWTSAGLAGIDATHPLFMVVEYAGPTCANNIKVMQIQPKIAFTVDITNMTHGTSPTPIPFTTPVPSEGQCYANVTSVEYKDGKINIDYGTNVLYFEVIGANFTGSYKPTLKLTGLQGTQTAAIDWGVAIGTYNQALVVDQLHTAGAITSGQFIVTTTEPSTNNGVSIYVRVTIRNHGWEGLTDEPITLAVEAVDDTPASHKDVDVDCTTITEYGDLAIQTLQARPAVAPGTPILTQNP